MHPHLEGGHGRPRPPRDFVVRQPFDMLQHEDFALLRREVSERPLECPHPLRLLVRPIGPVGGRHTVISLVERPPFPLLPAPLSVAAIAQDQEQPPRKLVRLAAIRQAIERPHQRVLHLVFARVEGAQHARRVARIAVAVAMHQHRVPLHLAPQYRPHDLAVRCVARETQPSPSLPAVVQVMLGEADEVVAETFAYVWLSAARFVETANTSVATWLGEITRSRARAVLLSREWAGGSLEPVTDFSR